MNVVVHIIVTGIVALTPVENASTMSGAWNVIVPDIRQPHGQDSRHVPHLLADATLSSEEGSREETAIFSDGISGRVRIWDLTDADLLIVDAPAAGGDATLPESALLMKDACEPGRENCVNLREDVFHGRRPTPKDKYGSAGRLYGLPATVKATSVRSDLQWFLERGSTKTSPEPLAQELCLSFDHPHAELKLLVSERGLAPRTITLRPDSNGRIELRIGNLMEKDINPSCPHETEKEDKHFQLYYKVNQGKKLFERIAKLKLYEGDGEQSRIGGPDHDHRISLRPKGQLCKHGVAGSNCPPTVWDPYP